MRLLLFLTCLAYLRFCSSTYEYICPTALSWRIRSKALCKSTAKYSCLHDENKDTSREICRETPSMLAPGNRYVIRGNLDGEDCKGNRFQPFIFQTSHNNECAIKKSNCNEAGQIMYSNGSTTEDKSCRCDYSKSYAPIQKPSNPCYCMPSTEDCSCYLKLCPDKTHLSSEYTCVSIYTLVTLDYCGPMKWAGSENPNLFRTIEGNVEKDKLKSERFADLFLVACITVIAGLHLAAIVCIISGKYFNKDNRVITEVIEGENLNDDNRAKTEVIEVNTGVTNELSESRSKKECHIDEQIEEKKLKAFVKILLKVVKLDQDKEKGNVEDKTLFSGNRHENKLCTGIVDEKKLFAGNVYGNRMLNRSNSSIFSYNSGDKVDSNASGNVLKRESDLKKKKPNDKKIFESNTVQKHSRHGSDSNINEHNNEQTITYFLSLAKEYLKNLDEAEKSQSKGKEKAHDGDKNKQHGSDKSMNEHKEEKSNQRKVDRMKTRQLSEYNLIERTDKKISEMPERNPTHKKFRKSRTVDVNSKFKLSMINLFFGEKNPQYGCDTNINDNNDEKKPKGNVVGKQNHHGSESNINSHDDGNEHLQILIQMLLTKIDETKAEQKGITQKKRLFFKKLTSTDENDYIQMMTNRVKKNLKDKNGKITKHAKKSSITVLNPRS